MRNKMSNSTIVLEELNKLNAFSGKLNKHAKYMSNSLDAEIPESMRLNIANYTLASYISHFHVKIVLEDSFIPTNFIAFTLAKSGASKTSSVNKLERALGSGYDIIEQSRLAKAEIKAREVAEANDDENHLKYLKPLNPLFNSISTEAGMIKKLNSFAEEGLGLPSLFVDEVGTELQCNPDIVHNIKLVSELFDSGNKKSRALASEEHERPEVKGMGMCAMFIGSEHNVLLDEAILKKFLDEFVTKLARRCFFDFPEFDFVEKECDDIESILSSEDDSKEFQVANSLEIRDMALNVAEKLIDNDINNVMISTEADRLYRIYKFHCKYKAEELTVEATILEQLHRHWKVLKLAGVYAVADERNSISSDDLIEAISFAEMLDGHLGKFIELSKREHHEILIDNLRLVESLTIHELKKKDIITGRASPDNQINSLISLGNSKLGKEGMLVYNDGSVSLELFKKAEHGASYIQVSGTKEERSWKTKEGYIYNKTTFVRLGNLLSNDTAYCAFEFTDGVRSNDNICSGATFVVLDIDDSDITWTEAHDMLQDYKHLIAQTSSADNPYKFRVIVELDIEVNLDSRLWKNFMAKVGEHLGLELDLLAKSQIYYGFKGREVLSNLDGDPLPASELIKTIDAVPKEVKRLSVGKVNEAYENRFEIFKYAYEVGGQTGAASMFRAFKHAQDLGMVKQQVLDLLHDVCEYRDTDFDYIMKRTGMMNQINKAFNL